VNLKALDMNFLFLSAASVLSLEAKCELTARLMNSRRISQMSIESESFRCLRTFLLDDSRKSIRCCFGLETRELTLF
jgi:hypothetical protein